MAQRSPVVCIKTRSRWLTLMGLAWLAGCGGSSDAGVNTPAAAATATAPTAPTLGAANLAVLIAQGDATSEAIARAYQQARGIPDANMIRLAVPAGSAAISAQDFATLKASLDSQLGAHVQATLVTWTQPSRVLGACSMGLTSALAFGYDARWCGGCARTTPSPYYNAATRQPFTDLQLRPSMMLGAATLAEAQALINRGVAADASWAGGASSGQALLVRTSDNNRSVRYPDFQVQAARSVAGLTMRYSDNSAGRAADEISGQSDVMVYLTGLPAVTQAASNRYLPGAVADTLTSFAGVLPNANGQMPVTAWLSAGATASYGTVEEPCNFTEKFPRATVLLSRYAGGETLIEAYWKSVQWPGQGLFVGEPLARPWATR